MTWTVEDHSTRVALSVWDQPRTDSTKKPSSWLTTCARQKEIIFLSRNLLLLRLLHSPIPPRSVYTEKGIWVPPSVQDCKVRGGIHGGSNQEGGSIISQSQKQSGEKSATKKMKVEGFWKYHISNRAKRVFSVKYQVLKLFLCIFCAFFAIFPQESFSHFLRLLPIVSSMCYVLSEPIKKTNK